jgi:hypothetical protein
VPEQFAVGRARRELLAELRLALGAIRNAAPAMKPTMPSPDASQKSGAPRS